MEHYVGEAEVDLCGEPERRVGAISFALFSNTYASISTSMPYL
jgi:hypothetical protein